MLKKDKDYLQNFSEAIQQEWLETNGLGGWAGSSLVGANTRRYHGLLVAAIAPPAERMVLLSRLEETMLVGDQRLGLAANIYAGGVTHPNGHQYLRSFSKDLFPCWEYEAAGIRLKKTIGMLHGENTTLIIYEVAEAVHPFRMELRPFLAVRGYHALMHANESIKKEADFANDTFSLQAYETSPGLYIKVPGAEYLPDPDWYLGYNYTVEQYRGLDFEEDLFNPGRFIVELKKGDRLEIIVSTDNPAARDAGVLMANETLRRQELLRNQPADQLFRQLVLAADQFIVQRDSNMKTIIAGYHWFTDWGRDTMISLPGLCLSTGRHDDARKILSAFAASVSQGMLPNRFQDNGDEPEYNNVDGTLWYFIAIYKYLQTTGDTAYVLNELLPVLKEIIDWHFKGTRYNIHVDNDGLLYAGEAGQQLTWMDARIGDWVVTPRMGKPVEIQALWYNALRIFAELLEMNGQDSDAALVNYSAEKVKQVFMSSFWYAEGNYLYDVINEQGQPDASLRPNQLFAISLPFKLIDGEKAVSVLQTVAEQLYTPVGLKSLAASDNRYTPVYGGDVWHRDSAYHQGTVWSWLLGPYTDAIMSVYGSLEKAREVIDNFAFHLEEGCIGSVSEIFDADAPHHPRGCVAQAWGVAELLRIMKDYGLSKNSL